MQTQWSVMAFKNYASIEIIFGGDEDPLKICGVFTVYSMHSSSYSYLITWLWITIPIAIKSRWYSFEDTKFIKRKILLSECITEPSFSLLHAQVLVTKNENHKKRIVVDYSFSSTNYGWTVIIIFIYIITVMDEPYTAFEACERLNQFIWIPFGVCNGVSFSMENGPNYYSRKFRIV